MLNFCKMLVLQIFHIRFAFNIKDEKTWQKMKHF